MDTTIAYRPLLRRDLPALRVLAGRVWTMDSYSESKFLRFLIMEHYLSVYLAQHNYSLVAEQGGKAVGFLLGRRQSTFDPNAQRHWQRQTARMAFFLRFFPIGRVYLHNMDLTAQADRQLMGQRRFDGELLLFAVEEALRGEGVGRRLLDGFRRFAAEGGADTLFLFTDSYSTVDYYRQRGYRQISSVPVDFRDEKPTYYLFAFPDNWKDCLRQV